MVKSESVENDREMLCHLCRSWSQNQYYVYAKRFVPVREPLTVHSNAVEGETNRLSIYPLVAFCRFNHFDGIIIHVFKLRVRAIKCINKMAENEDSDGSDEWGMEELVIPTNQKGDEVDNNKQNNDDDDDNDDDWQVKIEKPSQAVPPVEQPKTSKAVAEFSETMILVDMTELDSNIHSRFDKNSVSDPVAASALRKKIELEYATYSKDASMISNGTIIPCGSSVWRDALVQLREQRAGHYFAPIFPPRK